MSDHLHIKTILAHALVTSYNVNYLFETNEDVLLYRINFMFLTNTTHDGSSLLVWSHA